MPLHAEIGNTRLTPVAHLIGVPELSDPQASGLSVKAAVAAACVAYPDLATALPPVASCAMADTMAWLCSSAGLTEVEASIFELTVAFRAFSPLRQAVQTWGPIYSSDYTHAIAILVGYSEQDVEVALHPSSTLCRSGLVRSSAESYDEGHLYTMLTVSRGLAYRIEHNQGQPFEVMDRLVAAMPAPTLTLSDFPHLANHTQLAHSWLNSALARSRRQASAGHMLVSGEPGLGKTEWVRALLDAARRQGTVHPLEMAALAVNGKALNGEERLDNLRLALIVFRNAQGGVLLFDEADDVFEPSGPLVSSSTETNAYSMANHRAAINRLVEESRIPIIWIMNHPDVLDPAVLRRFDVVFKLEAMPRSVRVNLLKSRLPQVWDSKELSDWSEVHSLTPALIDRLAVIQREATDAAQPMDAAQCRHWLRQRLPGHATRKLARYDRSGTRSKTTTTTKTTTSPAWNPEWVNASYDLLELAEGIRRSGFGRILLHGLPGTGKTAYAYELARRLDLPIMEQRASDLLSPYVGETEQRIASAFESAMQDEAVLFLDEADSVLSIRNQAHRSWEVTQVNEMLQQLADFDGVVVLATNRTDALDPAVLRRLDARIAFLPLNPVQIEKRFTALCKDLGLDQCPLFELAGEVDVAMNTNRRKLSALTPLTPGDFDVLQRRHAFAPFGSIEELGDALADEVRAKPGGPVAMGFYQSNNENNNVNNSDDIAL
ncbi:MAG: ATP-binding protein [Rhodoferax sp.]